MRDGKLQVTVVYAPRARQVHQVELLLGTGATVAHALTASALEEGFPELVAESLQIGIWGRKAGLAAPLHDRDRVEVYRPLQVDPKVARRARFAAQGARATGLFANRRPGAKAGY